MLAADPQAVDLSKSLLIGPWSSKSFPWKAERPKFYVLRLPRPLLNTKRATVAVSLAWVCATTGVPL